MNTPTESSESSSQSRAHFSDHEIDFGEIFSVLWAGKKVVVSLSFIAGLMSIIFALSIPNTYTASTLLSPAEQSSGGLSSLMSQYGGLASLAGLSLPSGGDASKAQLGIQLMQSRAFISEFVARRALLQDLMAVESWNVTTGEITYDPDIYDESNNTWTREADAPFLPEPSAQEAYKEFIDILTISEDPQTGYVSVSIRHQSPVIAARWLDWLVKDVNAAVKTQDVTEATRSIEYLKQQIANTSLADLQAMFFELIQSQTETVMLAEVRPEYVFKTIDPAIAPEEKSGPSRALICVAGTFLGGIAGCILVLFRRRETSYEHTKTK
jgi:uncharacterized protein involved in exopolysaccharide biosynthesis